MAKAIALTFALIMVGLAGVNGITCHCTGRQNPDSFCFANNTCHSKPGVRAVCFNAVTFDDLDGESFKSQGCYKVVEKDGRSDWLPGTELPFRCLNSLDTLAIHNIRCCKSDYCNTYELSLATSVSTIPAAKEPAEDHTHNPERSELSLPVLVTVIVVPVIVVCAVFVLLGYYYFKSSRTRLSATSSYDTETDPMIPNSSSLQQLLEFSHSGSGGGGGLPLMMQITIARQIQLEEIVGMGRFGDVKRGKWRGDNVAVKIFHSREEMSWFREAEIYQTAMLRHDNILGFIAADNIDNGTLTQLLLVTEYHERGSLYEHLTITELDISAMIKICHSIACGLAHLHMEIVGRQGKPAIAHRDLKSKNILVKRDGVTCCIADMGLAVKHESQTDTLNLPADNHRVGTNRYMPPEVLTDVINMQNIDSFKQGDVYSLSLVYWEVCRRVSVGGGKSDDYQLPYYDMVPSDPTTENMRAVVCERKLRPSISNRYHDIETLRNVSKMVKECWHEKPAARLTALRIKKTLATIAQQEKVSIDV